MKHSALVSLACKWLEGHGAKIVLAEPAVRLDEQPDAIGWWTDGHTVVIECKRTRKDFLAEWSRSDRKVFRRKPEEGMGIHRYYLAPYGIVTTDSNCYGWGVIQAFTGRVVVSRESDLFQPNREAEMKLLVRALPRVKIEERIQQLQIPWQNDC